VIDTRAVRRLWRVFEPYHAITYFSPETTNAFKSAGLRGFWMGYFAGRAAPMGRVGSGVVTATFYNFAPKMVSRAIPDAWEFAPTEAVLDARMAGVDVALRRILGDRLNERSTSEAASIAQEAVNATNPAGRPLFAANAELSPPSEPHLRLWWAVTCLREHRGDGHVASLLQAGVDGCEAHVTLVATGSLSREVLQPNRGWTDEEWESANERLRARGWLESDGTLSAEGRSGRRHLENDTDRLAEEPWRRIGDSRTERFMELLTPLTDRILSLGDIPTQNPVGLPPK
jgi:Helix-turn-helix family